MEGRMHVSAELLSFWARILMDKRCLIKRALIAMLTGVNLTGLQMSCRTVNTASLIMLFRNEHKESADCGGLKYNS